MTKVLQIPGHDAISLLTTQASKSPSYISNDVVET